MVDKASLIARLDRIADSLVPVAGALMQRACGDDYEHAANCNCYTCRAFVASQAATTELSRIIDELRSLTSEEAQKAYDEAPTVPLSAKRIQEIVDYATKGDT